MIIGTFSTSGFTQPQAATTRIQREPSSSSKTENKASPAEDKVTLSTRLSPEEQKEVEQLKARDREVKAHEQAHVNALGGYARGGPKYEYQTGPDGKRYAVGGSVDVDTSEETTPEKTVQKMQTIQRAALAPAEPSSADRAVASDAQAKEQKARTEMREQADGPTSSAIKAYTTPQPAEKSGLSITA